MWKPWNCNGLKSESKVLFDTFSFKKKYDSPAWIDRRRRSERSASLFVWKQADSELDNPAHIVGHGAGLHAVDVVVELLADRAHAAAVDDDRSEEHMSELQSQR